MPLEEEARTFLRELPSLLSSPENLGRFALIRGDAVFGVWPTCAAALEAGYERFGLTPFMVREIAEPREAPYFARNLERNDR